LILFSSDGTFLLKWGNYPGLWFPTGIGIDLNNDWIWVADSGNDKVKKFDTDGNFILQIWGYDLSSGRIDNPNDVSVDKDGNVYMSDEYNHRIQKYDATGNFITKWGNQGSEDGQFDYPLGIDIDSDGNVYVSDNSNRVQKFATFGFIKTWGSQGTGNR